jgi:hypothetical protein
MVDHRDDGQTVPGRGRRLRGVQVPANHLWGAQTQHTLRERSAKWNERKGNGTAMSFGDRLLNECAGATTSCGSRESSAYVAGFSTIGGIDWTRPTLRRRDLAR